MSFAGADEAGDPPVRGPRRKGEPFAAGVEPRPVRPPRPAPRWSRPRPPGWCPPPRRRRETSGARRASRSPAPHPRGAPATAGCGCRRRGRTPTTLGGCGRRRSRGPPRGGCPAARRDSGWRPFPDRCAGRRRRRRGRNGSGRVPGWPASSRREKSPPPDRGRRPGRPGRRWPGSGAGAGCRAPDGPGHRRRAGAALRRREEGFRAFAKSYGPAGQRHRAATTSGRILPGGSAPGSGAAPPRGREPGRPLPVSPSDDPEPPSAPLTCRLPNPPSSSASTTRTSSTATTTSPRSSSATSRAPSPAGAPRPPPATKATNPPPTPWQHLKTLAADYGRRRERFHRERRPERRLALQRTWLRALLRALGHGWNPGSHLLDDGNPLPVLAADGFRDGSPTS